MGERRNQSIDIVKGIGILLMIVGHSYSTDAGRILLKWIYSFHMPLFFITTGVLAGCKGGYGGVNLKKKIRTLIIPYYVFATLYQLFVGVLAIIGGAEIKSTILYRLGLVISFEGSAMWFLPTMFVVSAVFSITQRWKVFQGIMAGFAMLTWMYTPVVHGFWGCFYRALPGFTFVVIGYSFYEIFSKKRDAYIVFAALFIHIFSTFSNITVDLAYHSVGNPLLYIAESITGTFVTYQFSLRVDNRAKGIARCGRYSVMFLCLHEFVIQVLRLLDYKLWNIFPAMSWVEGIALTAIVVLIIYWFIPLVEKYAVGLFGIKRSTKINLM